MNILVVSCLGLFQMKVPGIFMDKILFLYMLSFLLSKYLVVECLDHMICICLAFLRNCLTLFLPEWSYHFTPPSAVHECSISFPSLPTLGRVRLFHSSHSNKCVVISYCGFNCISLKINDVENILPCVCLSSTYLLW